MKILDFIYYIYPDDLGTPRHITDTSNNPKWSWDNIEPFGDNSPNETISGSTFKFNLRFPGQYYDEESGLSYNFYRDYNSQIGRYNESDPIGLSGGINTYSYVENNSLSGIDFFGLDPWFNEIYSKKIELNDNQTIKWINRAREEKAPFYYLANKRRLSLDKYDSNLVAAERYCMSYYSKDNSYLEQYLLLGQHNLKKFRDTEFANYLRNNRKISNFLKNNNLGLIIGKNGSPSSDSFFTMSWGYQGIIDRELKKGKLNEE